MKIRVKSPEKNYYLLYQEKKIPLHESLTLGSKEAGLVLEDDEISSKHCTVEQLGDSLVLVDHHSFTGTYVSQMKIRPEQKFFLLEGDFIRLGTQVFEVQSEKKGIKSFTAIDPFKFTPSQEEIAPLFYRWTALIIDLSLAFILKDFIRWPEFFHVIPDFFQKSFVLTFIFLQLVSSLVFNVTLGQAYLNCYSYSWPLGFIRTFLGLVTFPFFIFDFPLFWKKKSLKEVLTKPLMSQKDVPLMKILFVFPSLLLIFYSYPLWKGGKIIKGDEILLPTTRLIEKNLGERQFFVKNFQLAFYSDDFIIYPIFREKEDKKVEVALKVKKDLHEMTLSLKKKIHLKNLLEEIDLIPFFLKFYEKDFFYLKDQNFSGNFAKTLETSFRLSLKEIFLSFKDYFPYYLHKIHFRRKILEVLEVESLDQAAIINLGDQFYLVLKRENFLLLALNKEFFYLYEVEATSLNEIQNLYKNIRMGSFDDYFIPIDFFYEKDLSGTELVDYLKEMKEKLSPLVFESLKSQILLLVGEKKLENLGQQINKI